MNSVSAPALLLLVVVALATVHAAPRDGPASTECPAGIKAAKAGPAAQGVKYTTKYDNINVDMVLHNERLLNNYMECLMDRRACSKEGQLLKEIIPDALQTDCARCSEKQKQIAGTIMSYLLQYKKKYWDELLCKYDPEGNFRKKYEVDEDDEDDEE
ncbi:ejaculatory bulb-specific protein 3 [Frankliniella occidentalis]|uniref:Chemosensory protein 1 n=1 Tax=Frankliniella occidentalis TaxID=133901 RepID=A0A6J1T4D8_FRAOC|nr:ejaculatory bulb-specific protein 3 [Frankliniella occidentalis]WBW64316.1 CSP6 [Frankliniella occidentalis]